MLFSDHLANAARREPPPKQSHPRLSKTLGTLPIPVVMEPMVIVPMVMATAMLLVMAITSPLAIAQEPAPTVPREVTQLLKRHCVKCHGVAKSEAGLQLHTALRIWKGGETGHTVVAGSADKSELWKRVVADEMPPEMPLADNDKKILREWIAGGATGLPRDNEQAAQMQQDEHWAFTRLKPAALPNVKRADLCRTPIDIWLQSELERVGLTLSADADRATLLRRVSFSLTGLPPTLQDMQTYFEDTHPDAYERMVDRYLASPQFGIRWGRHWLDAAGYADSNGYFNADSDRPLAYKYRDYVVRAINADKPFDRFVQEQIAGDELSGYTADQHRAAADPEMIDQLIATHYLRNGQDGSGESDGNPDEVRIDRYTALESSQQIIASSLLGLTLQCAKCHDHKFEPVSQRDFYNFQSILFPAFNPDEWVKPNERVTQASTAEEYNHWKSQLDVATAQVDRLHADYQAWLKTQRLPELVLFHDEFESDDQLSENWSATIPGDDAPAGTAEITLRAGAAKESAALPAALIHDGHLQIIEGGTAGDKWLSTRQVFDWTPADEGQWIQVSFDLIDNKVDANGTPAERIAFGIALHDYNNNSSVAGGNLLIDGNPAGGAVVDLDYPGPSTRQLGKIGSDGYVPQRNYGVRITRLPKKQFRLEQLVDLIPQEPALTLKAADLPDGSFGFEYCCGRSFQVDNLVIEVSHREQADEASRARLTAHAEEVKRRQSELQSARKQRDTLKSGEPGRIAWVTDVKAQPPEVYLLARGDYGQRASQVEPAAFTALDEPGNPFTVQPTAGTSGRRLAWARWATHSDSRAAHLMARVQVNRLWQHHFGTGLVATSENLGMSGAEPTNVALLDWLAQELIAHQWSMKALHRAVLHSTAFRQSSLANDQALAIDRANQLLWRYPMRRLDAEAIRDAQLSVAGQLDHRFEGPYVATTRTGTAEVIVPEDRPDAFRRSIYLQQRRSQALSLLSVFDAPNMVVNCSRRPVTTMPLQSLSLLNSEFAVRRSQQLAERLQREGQNDAQRVDLAFQWLTGRSPDPQQRDDALDFIQSQSADAGPRAWADLCQMLMASNLFLYLE